MSVDSNLWPPRLSASSAGVVTGWRFAKAEGRSNPITGQHVELTVEPMAGRYSIHRS